MHAPDDLVDEHSALRIVHALPGRLRLRAPARAVTEELAQAIRGLAGVRTCRWSARTRSVLVTFDPETITADAIARTIAHHIGIDGSLVNPAREHRVASLNGRATFAAGVTETIAEVDRRMQRTTRGLLGLGAVVPLALAGWAVRELALGRAAPLAWSSALWYAHGLFRDYNSPSAS